ncbi:unnamed protein product, partial [Iphiclides podalirius]
MCHSSVMQSKLFPVPFSPVRLNALLALTDVCVRWVTVFIATLKAGAGCGRMCHSSVMQSKLFPVPFSPVRLNALLALTDVCVRWVTVFIATLKAGAACGRMCHSSVMQSKLFPVPFSPVRLNALLALTDVCVRWVTVFIATLKAGAACGRMCHSSVMQSKLFPVPFSPARLNALLALTDVCVRWVTVFIATLKAGAACGRMCHSSVMQSKLFPVPFSPVRLNALLALTDVCVRYTCIVEPLLDSVCQCVNVETVPPLRRAAARALTRLLLAGYLRLRTPLYYRYCALLADEDHDVREPAEYYVSSCLTSDSIYHHFVDCILHYNGEDAEPISFDARQLIYDVMLQRLSLVQKLNVQCRLAREVLEHAADVTDEKGGEGELPPALHAALLDTITLLCGPRMRLPKKPQTTGDMADIDDLQERVTTNIVSHKMKRTVAEVLVPAVLRLYARMRPHGGQLAAYLVRIATDLLNDYRQEIEELIDNDEELVRRVQHFQQTIGLEPSFGNARNLVTASAPPDPDTPRAQRRRAPRGGRESPRKRPLRI